jgi:glyoxylase-like metal-dependent hydrolase (beta-lactamase superfamily II)
MLESIADGVLVHVSEFIQSNSIVVQGPTGALLIDPGITGDELACLASDLREAGLPVVAGFSTHPDWDHALWHPELGDAPRYGTADGAAYLRDLLARPDWEEQLAGALPPEHAAEIPTELFGRIAALPAGAVEIPWDGPRVRIIEHRGHARGHAALLVEHAGVLVAGDMLSDILMPFLDLDAPAPIDDYLAGLRLFERVAPDVRVVVPGHGSVGDAADVRARLALDRAYVESLRDGRAVDDPRVGPSAPLYGLADVHEWQARRLAERGSAPPA